MRAGPLPLTLDFRMSYNDERTAEFLLSNAVDAEDYARAREEVRSMGLDPDAVAHRKPA